MLESESATEVRGGCSLQTTEQPGVNPVKWGDQSQELLGFYFLFLGFVGFLFCSGFCFCFLL